MGFFDTLMGKDSAAASKAAAQDTYAKQQAAAGQTRQAGSDYLSGMMQTSRNYDPYVQQGQNANQLYSNFIGANGADAQRGAYNNYVASPATEWLMGQGGRAIDNSGSARSMTNSGTTLKALMRFGQGTAMGGLDNNLNRLQGLGQQGFGATQAQSGLQGQGYQGQLQANMGAAGQMYGGAGTIGQGDVAAAQAESAGVGNLVKMGMQGAGMFMGGFGGGGMGSSFNNAGSQFNNMASGRGYAFGNNIFGSDQKAYG